MPFGDRHRPKLSERIRGKTADQILEEINKKFNRNNNSNMFFDKNTPVSSPERPPSETSALEEFPFDDDTLTGHLSVRSHLEDLAKKFPDIADHLRCPPWGGEPSSKRWSHKRNVSGDENTSEEPSDLNQNSTEHFESSPNQKRFEDNMDNQQQNPTENISEPSGNNDEKAQQRFVSKLEITPMNASNQTENVQQQQPQPQPHQPPQQTQQQQPPQQQQQHKEPQRDSTPPQGAQKPHVRVIPIQVEGRSNPVYPKNTDNDVMGSNVPKQNLGKTQFSHHSFHDRDNSPRRQTPPPSSHQQQHAAPQEPRSTPPPPPPRQQTKPLDALEKVRIVQTDVEELAKNVAQFSGNSRSDKQFIYLDEMLTRNLIKLDTIETEGRDDVRIARKKAIKTIQDNIAILEDKVPQTKSEPMVVEQSNEESGETVLSENQQPETQQSQTDAEISKK